MIQTGSVVQRIDDSFKDVPPISLPVKGNFYYVTGIREFHKGVGVYLDEIRDRVRVDGLIQQAPFHVKRFREVDVQISQIILEEVIHTTE